MSDLQPDQNAPQNTAPQQPAGEPLQEFEMASYAQRLGAALIDGFIGFSLMMPIYSHYGLWEAIKDGKELPTTTEALLVVIAISMFFALHGLLLHRYGQTIGKRLLNIAIVGVDNDKLPLGHLILNRYLPQWVAGSVPVVAPILAIIDTLYIFHGSKKRCVHDLIAKTKVVDLSRPIRTLASGSSRQSVLEV